MGLWKTFYMDNDDEFTVKEAIVAGFILPFFIYKVMEMMRK